MSARTDAIRQIAAKTSHTTTNSRAIDIYIHPNPKIEKGGFRIGMLGFCCYSCG
jgi:hypothetical protein